MTDNYRPRNLRIFTHASAHLILHIEDVLDLGKVALDLWQFTKGNGASKHICCYIDANDARLIAHQIIVGGLTKWQDYKGGANKSTGEIVSRVTNLEWTTTDRGNTGLRVNLATGPGRLNETRAVMPAGKLDSLTTFIPAVDALSMALAIREHLQAWAAATYYARKDDLWKPE